MGQEYEITKVERRNEWTFQGSQMQDYAITLQGETGWIKLTQKYDTQPPQAGDKLFGVVETKTNKNGNEYRKFTKKNPNFGGNAQTGGVDSEKLDYAIMMLEEMTGRRKVQEETPETSDPFGDLGI